MKPIAKERVREYRSALRAHQAEETRARILDATLRVMARGVASLSIPAVAREAGVSVPTIYRHFGSKAALLAALHAHIGRRVGLDQVRDPSSLDELHAFVQAMFEGLDTHDVLAIAAMASPVGAEVRKAVMPSRFERIRRFTDAVGPSMPDVERSRLARVLTILTSSSALRIWRDQIGSSVDEAADDVDWIVRAALAAAQRRTT